MPEKQETKPGGKEKGKRRRAVLKQIHWHQSNAREKSQTDSSISLHLPQIVNMISKKDTRHMYETSKINMCISAPSRIVI